MTLFERAAAVKWKRASKANGQDAVYRRGNRTCPLVVCRTKPEKTELAGESATVQTKRWDFIILANDLRFGPLVTQPCLGDEIEIAEAIGTVRYEVIEVEPHGCWRHHDLSRVTLRVFTQEIEVRHE